MPFFSLFSLLSIVALYLSTCKISDKSNVVILNYEKFWVKQVKQNGERRGHFSLTNTTYSTYCKPSTILSALQILTHYPYNSCIQYYYYLHSTERNWAEYYLHKVTQLVSDSVKFWNQVVWSSSQVHVLNHCVCCLWLGVQHLRIILEQKSRSSL